MLRGTRILSGDDVRTFNFITNTLRLTLNAEGFEEIFVPSIWERDTFYDKVGAENQKMMWEFRDKGDREVCLIPEVTGLIQETWRKTWRKERKTWNVFYIARCYRYERPQAGRYREFTQFGIEMLGSQDVERAKSLLQKSIALFGDRAYLPVYYPKTGDKHFDYEFQDSVKRGLSYYVENGFEVLAPALGAQKQIAGGGAYKEGVGWAIGVDRLALLIKPIITGAKQEDGTTDK